MGRVTDPRTSVARIFEEWLARENPGSRWIVEVREGPDRDGAAPGAGHVGGQLAATQLASRDHEGAPAAREGEDHR